MRTNTKGNINIITKTLNVLDGAKINTNSAYNNSAGNINIEAQSITVSGFIPRAPFEPSAIASSVNIRSTANVEQIIQNNSNLAEAGKINIETNKLKILDGARIESINNLGNSGIITINAQDIELNGTRPKVVNFIGGISTSTRETSVGNGGDITINTSSLKVLNGSIIRAISLGSGDLVSPPNSEPLVEQTIISQRGIQQIRLPTFVELQKNKIYLWNISIPCNDVTNDYQATLTSGIERVSLSPSKTRQIDNSQSNYEKFKIYADNGIWYETLDYAEKMTRLGYNHPLNQIFSDLRIKN